MTILENCSTLTCHHCLVFYSPILETEATLIGLNLPQFAREFAELVKNRPFQVRRQILGKPTRRSCDLPPAAGSGPFKIPRYYFDSSTKACQRFYYTGKDGNDNRFHKKHKCERLCLGSEKVDIFKKSIINLRET